MFFELICMKLLQMSADNDNTENYKNYSNSRTTNSNSNKKQDTKNTKNKDNNEESESGGSGSVLVFLLQLAIVCSAIYISFGRNDGFALGPLLLACCYPTFYLLYVLISGPVEA